MCTTACTGLWWGGAVVCAGEPTLCPLVAASPRFGSHVVADAVSFAFPDGYFKGTLINQGVDWCVRRAVRLVVGALPGVVCALDLPR